MRLKVKALEHAPLVENRLADALRRHPGVTGVRNNAACRSIVVDFVPGSVDETVLEERIQGVLSRLHGAERGGGLRPVLELTPRVRRRSARSPQAQMPSVGATMSPYRTSPMVRRQPRTQPSALCRLQARTARWMLRAALRCWWYDFTVRLAGACAAVGGEAGPVRSTWRSLAGKVRWPLGRRLLRWREDGGLDLVKPSPMH